MTRQVFLEAGRQVVELLAHPDVAGRWREPSVLRRMTVGALAGHLSRSILQVEGYLDRPYSDARPIDAPAYYLRLDDPADLDSDLNAAVRDRAEQAAAGGPGAVAEEAAASLSRLTGRLGVEPQDRLVEAFGSVLLLDEYLKTRLVEMTVHHDDLRRSIDGDVDDLTAEAYDIAIDVMVETAVRRHGRTAVLTALTRRERDPVNALRVL